MPVKTLIPIKTFCVQHNITTSFVQSLEKMGIIETIYRENDGFLHLNQVIVIEKIIRLYRDLEINPEGIHAIFYLLERMEKMQQEIQVLRNRLSLYE